MIKRIYQIKCSFNASKMICYLCMYESWISRTSMVLYTIRYNLIYTILSFYISDCKLVIQDMISDSARLWFGKLTTIIKIRYGFSYTPIRSKQTYNTTSLSSTNKSCMGRVRYLHNHDHIHRYNPLSSILKF